VAAQAQRRDGQVADGAQIENSALKSGNVPSRAAHQRRTPS